MPELPDLEVFSKNLNKQLKGKELDEISIHSSKKLEVPLSQIQKELHGATVERVIREGKELHIHFSNKHILGLHLMLNGELYLFEKSNEHNYTIAEFCFTDDTGLALTDMQGLAVVKYNPEKSDVPDALSADVAYLKKGFANSKAGIKGLLINQKFIRGIGNAYADEILWDARIAPLSIAGKIPTDKVEDLAKSIKQVLEEAQKQIVKSHPDIISGEIRDFLLIHHPKKKHSPTGAAIKQETVASKKTYYTEEQELYK